MALFSSRKSATWIILLQTFGGIMAPVSPVEGFATAPNFLQRNPTRTTSSSSALSWSSDSGDSDSSSSSFDEQARKELSDRLQELHRNLLEEEWQRPPNAAYSPQSLVEAILQGLWESDDPLPDSGFLLLLQTATPSWRRKIFQSIGAPYTAGNANWQVVSSALGAAISRPKNQYGLLVSSCEDEQEESDYETDDEEEEMSSSMPYILDFPFEPLDYDDGDAWLECRMRDKNTNQLLVTTGWSLKRRDDDGSWLVDHVIWHDLRDEFRPGVGQTEWLRVLT